MKKFFYLCMLALVPVFTLTACGDDDEEVKGEKIYDKDGVTLTESADQMVLTAVYGFEDHGTVTERVVADFKDGKCVKAVSTMTCPSEELAQEYYEEMLEDMDEDDDPNMYSRKGNVITSDFTSEWAGLSKEQVKDYMLRWAYEYGEKGNYEYVKPFSK